MSRLRKFLTPEQMNTGIVMYQKVSPTYIQRWMEEGVMTFDIAKQGLREIPVFAVFTKEKGLLRKNFENARVKAKKNNSTIVTEYVHSAIQQSSFVAEKIRNPIKTFRNRWAELEKLE